MDNIFKLIDKRDIVFLDLETTGVDVKKDRIVEIGMKKYTKNGDVIEYHSYINPDIPVEQEAIDKHGLTNEYLINYPKFSDIYQDIYEFIRDCDLGGYNIVKFDIQLLFEEFIRCEIVWDIYKLNIIDAYNLMNKYESRKLEDTYRRFFGKDMTDTHSTRGDINATIEIFNKQIDLYELKDNTIGDISNIIRRNDKNERFLDFDSWFIEKDGEIYLNKGNFRNKKASEHLDYVEWLYSYNKIPNNVKYIAKLILKKYKK